MGREIDLFFGLKNLVHTVGGASWAPPLSGNRDDKGGKEVLTLEKPSNLVAPFVWRNNGLPPETDERKRLLSRPHGSKWKAMMCYAGAHTHWLRPKSKPPLVQCTTNSSKQKQKTRQTKPDQNYPSPTVAVFFALFFSPIKQNSKKKQKHKTSVFVTKK